MNAHQLPLANVRIMDLTWASAGPTATRLLAMLGAEIIKIGSRRHPDSAAGPDTPRFPVLNTGKRSTTLNVADPRGLALAYRLVAVSDVVMDNFSTGVMERLGLGYEKLKAIKPDIIAIAVSGMGRTGPKRNEMAWGSLLQGYSGWSSMTGHRGKHPTVGGGWSDPMVGQTAALAIVAALHHRRQTGQGQYIDFSMFEATASTMVEPLMDFLFNRRHPSVTGNRDATHAPGNVYPCHGLDQWVAISVSSDQQWQALCKVIDRPELAADPRFADALNRKRNEYALDSSIAEWTRQRTPSAAAEALQQAGVPAGATSRFVDFLADPQVRARGFVHEHENLQGGTDITLSVPWTEEGVRPVRVRRASGFGEDNEYLSQQLLGLPPEEYQHLIDQQVIY